MKLQLVGLHMNGKAHKPFRFLFQLCRFLFRLYLVARLVPLASRSYREREFNPDRRVCFQTESGSDIYPQHALCESFKQQARYIFFHLLLFWPSTLGPWQAASAAANLVEESRPSIAVSLRMAFARSSASSDCTYTTSSRCWPSS
jgi:hypothetical protein